MIYSMLRVSHEISSEFRIIWSDTMFKLQTMYIDGRAGHSKKTIPDV